MKLEIPSYIQTLKPYVPGKPISETKREFGLKRVIKLASNENALGVSPRALEALTQDRLQELYLYPDASSFELKAALARYLKRTPAEISLGNGSDELMSLMVRSFTRQGDAVATHQYAFIVFKVCAHAHGLKIHESTDVKLKPDLDALARVAVDSGARIVYLANPNNPTGILVDPSELRSLARELQRKEIFLLIDAAYHEYVESKDYCDPDELQREFDRVVILRTFSKIYGLAGARVGYAVAKPEIISYLERVRLSFNINSLAQAMAMRALEDDGFVEASKRLNREGHKFWESAARSLELPITKSDGNFIFADVQALSGKSGPEVFDACLREGVIFRPVANYGLPGHLRISFGKTEDNRFALEVLKKILGKPKRTTS